MNTEEDSLKAMKINWMGQTLELHPLKAIYWKEEESLIIADLHLGKAKHFVKAGIAIPAKAIQQKNIQRLQLLTDFYQPKRILLLGDLFHSDYNPSWESFCEYTHVNSSIKFTLVKGNHDILDKQNYLNAHLDVVEKLIDGPFSFSHEPTLKKTSSTYNFCGHIHPGVRLEGSAKLGARLPCFYFGKNECILPAFGAFTGLHIVSPKKKDAVYVVVDREVVACPV